MPVAGLNNALIPIVSFNYGAQQRERITGVIRFALAASIAIMAAGTVVMAVLPGPLLRLFEADAAVLAEGVPALRMIALSFVCAGVSVILCAALQALDLVIELPLGGEHDDGHLALPAQAAEHLHPREAGHVHVQKEQVDLVVPQDLQGLGAAFGLQNLKQVPILLFHQEPHDVAVLLLIIGYQQFVHSASSPSRQGYRRVTVVPLSNSLVMSTSPVCL